MKWLKLLTKKDDKVKPVLSEIERDILEYRSSRKHISSNELASKKVISYITTVAASMGCIMFGYRAGYEGAIMAACVSMIAYFLLRDHFRKHCKINTCIDWLVILTILSFEIICICAFFISDSKNADNSKVDAERARIQKQIDIEDSKVSPASEMRLMSKRDRADAAANNSKATTAKKALEKKMPATTKSGEGDFYKKVAAQFAVSVLIIELLFNVSLGALLVLANMIFVSRVNSYYCVKTLKIYKGMLDEEHAIINSLPLPTVEIENDEGGIKTGSVAPKDSQTMTIAEGYESAVKHVNGQIVGKAMIAKPLRDSTLQKTRDAQNKVLNLMKEKEIIATEKSGSSPKYYHFGHTPGDKKKGNLRDSYKPLKSVK